MIFFMYVSGNLRHIVYMLIRNCSRYGQIMEIETVLCKIDFPDEFRRCYFI